MFKIKSSNLFNKIKKRKEYPLIRDKVKKFESFCFREFKPKKFKFQEENYLYFYHIYNNAYKNERTVEIPIILEKIKENDDKMILEIGNVLSHYFPVHHEIVDKYEKAKGVINQDVVNFKSSIKYDLIFSISTLEHVGYDESLKDPLKILKAVDNLRKLIHENGQIIITLSLGYNHEMDVLLEKGRLGFTRTFYMMRTSATNIWKEVNRQALRNIEYNQPFLGANGIVIGLILKK